MNNEDIELYLGSLFASNNHRPFSCSVEGPVIKSGDTEIYRAECPSCPTPLAVKIIKGKTSSAEQQHNLLKRLGQSFGTGSSLRVPVTYGTVPGQNIHVMEWVGLPSLAKTLADWRTSFDAARMQVGMAGRWLRRLHNTREVGVTRLPVIDLCQQMDGFATTAPALTRQNSLFQCSCDDLRRTAAAIESIDMEETLQHGDFKPSNILCDTSQAVGIDIVAGVPGPAIRDISHFLNHLSYVFFLCPNPRLQRNLENLRRSFLTAYGMETGNIRDQSLIWLRLHYAVRDWAHSAARQNTPLRLRYVSAMFKRHVRPLLHQLQKQFG